MEPHVTANEARAALDSIERGRRQVIEQIALPYWYWFGLALGWIALGVITDLKHPWLTTAGTLLFGAVHSAVAPRVVDGRHRSGQVSVSRELAGRQTARIVLGGIVGCALLTIGGSLAVGADGAGHPVTITSVFVAVIIVLGGPQLLAAVRRRAARPTGR